MVKICTIKWERTEGTDFVEIKAIAPDGTVLFKKGYWGGKRFNGKEVDACHAAVYNWTREHGYTLKQD
jgi:hypothetical protein